MRLRPVNPSRLAVGFLMAAASRDQRTSTTMALTELTIGGLIKAAFALIPAAALANTGETAGAASGGAAEPRTVLPFPRIGFRRRVPVPDAGGLRREPAFGGGPFLTMPKDKPRDVLPQIRSRVADDVVPSSVSRARTLGPPLQPDRAARQFVRWMQEHEFHGEHPWAGANGIWEFYLWHCHEERLTPVPDNMFGDALEKVCAKRLVRDRSSGKLRRPTYYTIPELDAPKSKKRRRH